MKLMKFEYKRLGLRLCALALGCAAFTVHSADMPPEWKNSQPVQIGRPGLLKFSVPLETITAARPELEDLRLIDDAGHETPYVLERPLQPQRSVVAATHFEVSVNADTTVVTFQSGVKPPVSSITLVTPANEFLKAVKIEASPDQSSWQTLAQGQPIFRQLNGASNLDFLIPPGKGSAQFFRLTLDDHRSPPIAVTGAQIRTEPDSAAPVEPLGVSIVQHSDEQKQTRLELRLDGSNVMLSALTLQSGDPLFMRPVMLSEQRYAENEIREVVFLRDTVYRVGLEGQAAVSKLDFAVDVPIRLTRTLFVTIQNDDNPPLHIDGIQAQRRPVYLVFLAAQAGQYHLLSGNPQCPAPRYDLASLTENLNLKSAPQISAAPGALTQNPAYRQSDPLAEVQALGTAIDVTNWKYRKGLDLPKDGVQQVDADQEVMAHANGSFQDLRLVRGGKQIPYILERTAVRHSLSPKISAEDDPKRPHISRWKIVLPFRGLTIDTLTCSSTTAFFKRELRLYEDAPDERGNRYTHGLGSALWVRTLGQNKGSLDLNLAAAPITETLFLEMENGDNPPLDIGDVKAWYPVTRMLFKSNSDANTYLYYGNKAASPPSYDLELLVPKLLAAEKASATLRPEEILQAPSWSEDPRMAGSAGWIFWAVLGGVVVVLLIVIARMLPKPPAGA